jgi:hypothetical protein
MRGKHFAKLLPGNAIVLQIKALLKLYFFEPIENAVILYSQKYIEKFSSVELKFSSFQTH